MAYATYTPPPVLQPYVEKISIQESDPETQASTTRIVPTGTTDLLFHYGDPFVHVHDGQSIEQPSAYIAGQRTTSFDVSATGKTGIVIVNLKPWGLSGFTELATSEMTNQFIDMSSVFPILEIAALVDALRNEPLHRPKIELVQKFLIDKLNSKTDKMVLCGLEWLYQNLSGSISQMTTEFGVSKRQLDRRFLRHTGLTPKKMQTIVRFQQSLTELQSDLCQTAQHAGYFDQSHMNHDYQRFVGVTPTYVMTRSTATPLMRFYARRDNMSRFYNLLHLQ